MIEATTIRQALEVAQASPHRSHVCQMQTAQGERLAVFNPLEMIPADYAYLFTVEPQATIVRQTLKNQLAALLIDPNSGKLSDDAVFALGDVFDSVLPEYADRSANDFDNQKYQYVGKVAEQFYEFAAFIEG